MEPKNLFIREGHVIVGVSEKCCYCVEKIIKLK